MKRVKRSESARAIALPKRADQLGEMVLELARQISDDNSDESPLFGELAEAWLAWVTPRRVQPNNERRAVELLRPLASETGHTLTALKVEQHLEALVQEKGLGHLYANKMRDAGRLIVEHAQRRGTWRGPNPFKLAKRLKVPPREYEVLSLEDLALVQAALPERWLGLFRVSIHLGMRPGELFALRKEDVEIEKGVVRVRRSHARNTTKTGRTRLVPIVPAVIDDFRKAIETSQSGLVFPDDAGQRYSRSLRLTNVIRQAMAAAGVGVIGATYTCSRPRRRCSWSEDVPGPIRVRWCPRCARPCLVAPDVRPVRWYDLRHFCATLHHRHRADALCVSLALGHMVRGTTQTTYTHPDLDMIRTELSRWSLPPPRSDSR